MKKLIPLLAILPLGAAAVQTNEVLTVRKMTANPGDSAVFFVEGNPLPTECNDRFVYDDANAALVELLSVSRLGPETMLVGIEDLAPGVKNVCFVKAVSSI